MPDRVDVLERTVRKNDPVIGFVAGFRISRFGELAFRARAVFRMNSA